MAAKSRLTTLATELQEACTNYTPTPSLQQSPERDLILTKARQIMLEVSSPMHFTWTLVAHMYTLISLRTVMRLGILQRMPATGSISAQKLARQSGVQLSLLQRLMRVLVAIQFIEQDGENGYQLTRLSRAYAAVLGPALMFQITYDDCLPGLGRLHQYLTDRKSVSEPDDQAYNPFTWARGQDGRTVWDIMSETGGLERFQMALEAMDKRFPPTGFFDFGSLLVDGDGEGERDVLVEVGGGTGRSLTAIINSNPKLKGVPERFVLQDLDVPIKRAKEAGRLPEGVRAMVHDMFRPQPVKGPRAFYLRRVLHDYSDAKCISILEHLASAAAEDTLLLVSEMTVPDRVGEGELPIICMDMSMMNMGGKERSVGQFAEVFEAAGFELANVYEGFGTDRLLEARRTSMTKGA